MPGPPAKAMRFEDLLRPDEGDALHIRALYRTYQGAAVAGVCKGIADYFDLPVTRLRLVWLFFVFVFGSGLLLYLALWIIIPKVESGGID
jgi:phage shock protein PspC (stress-responsive transcriptional regulator)